MSSNNTGSKGVKKLKQQIILDEESSSETDAIMLDRIAPNLVDFKIKSNKEHAEDDITDESEEEKSKSEEIELYEEESDENKEEIGHETNVNETNTISEVGDVNGYSTDEDRRFPMNERETFKFGKVKVIHMGYKRSKTGKILSSIYRCRNSEVELPYIKDEDLGDLYEEPSAKHVTPMPDNELSREKEKMMGTPTFLITYSTVDEKEELSIRRTFNIGEDYEIIFPGKKAYAHEAPEGSLVVYLAQMRAGLRFPLHPLFKDIIRFWKLQLGQIMSNGIRVIIGFILLCKMHGVSICLDVFRHYFYISQKFGTKEGHGFFYFIRRSRSV